MRVPDMLMRTVATRGDFQPMDGGLRGRLRCVYNIPVLIYGTDTARRTFQTRAFLRRDYRCLRNGARRGSAGWWLFLRVCENAPAAVPLP